MGAMKATRSNPGSDILGKPLLIASLHERQCTATRTSRTSGCTHFTCGHSCGQRVGVHSPPSSALKCDSSNEEDKQRKEPNGIDRGGLSNTPSTVRFYIFTDRFGVSGSRGCHEHAGGARRRQYSTTLVDISSKARCRSPSLRTCRSLPCRWL